MVGRIAERLFRWGGSAGEEIEKFACDPPGARAPWFACARDLRLTQHCALFEGNQGGASRGTAHVEQDDNGVNVECGMDNDVIDE